MKVAGKKNGAFVLGIAEALESKKADFDQNGFIELKELVSQTKVAVGKLTDGNQTSELHCANLNFPKIKIAKLK